MKLDWWKISLRLYHFQTWTPYPPPQSDPLPWLLICQCDHYPPIIWSRICNSSVSSILSHSPSHSFLCRHIHGHGRTVYIVSISWIFPLPSIPIPSASIQIFISLFLDDQLTGFPSSSPAFLQAHLGAIAGGTVLNYTFEHESLYLPVLSRQTGQKLTP